MPLLLLLLQLQLLPHLLVPHPLVLHDHTPLAPTLQPLSPSMCDASCEKMKSESESVQNTEKKQERDRKREIWMRERRGNHHRSNFLPSRGSQ